MSKKVYEVTVGGPIGGVHYPEGAQIDLEDRQVKYLASRVRAVEPVVRQARRSAKAQPEAGDHGGDE